jgi:hypothetical protein
VTRGETSVAGGGRLAVVAVGLPIFVCGRRIARRAVVATEECNVMTRSRPSRTIARVLAALALASAIAAGPALAQSAKKDAPTPPPAAAPQTPQAAPQIAMPDGDKVLVLVRTSLLTLNDALLTGNFTVLRDKAAPSFQAANSAARLGLIFQGLLQARLDLTGVATLAPQLAETPAIDAQGHLRIRGHFQGQTARVDFNLAYEAVGGVWRLFGIAVNPAPVTAAVAPPAAQPAASEAGKPASAASDDKAAASVKSAASSGKPGSGKSTKTP